MLLAYYLFRLCRTLVEGVPPPNPSNPPFASSYPRIYSTYVQAQTLIHDADISTFFEEFISPPITHNRGTYKAPFFHPLVIIPYHVYT